MISLSFDIVTVGGGLAASAFAASMARNGMRVLVLEKETQFKDRVRGEFVATWGVAEARELGIETQLFNTCATPIPWIDMASALETSSRRPLNNCRACPSFTRKCRRCCLRKRNAPARRFVEE